MYNKIKEYINEGKRHFCTMFKDIIDIDNKKSNTILLMFIVELVFLIFAKNLVENNKVLECVYLYFEFMVILNIIFVILIKHGKKVVAKFIAIFSYIIFLPILFILKFAYDRIHKEKIESNTYIISITEFCIAIFIIMTILPSFLFIENLKKPIDKIIFYCSQSIKTNSLQAMILIALFYIIISIVDRFIIYIINKKYMKDFNPDKKKNNIKYLKSAFTCNKIIIMIIFFMVVSLSKSIENDLSSELINIVTMITLFILYFDKRKS